MLYRPSLLLKIYTLHTFVDISKITALFKTIHKTIKSTLKTILTTSFILKKNWSQESYTTYKKGIFRNLKTYNVIEILLSPYYLPSKGSGVM